VVVADGVDMDVLLLVVDGCTDTAVRTLMEVVCDARDCEGIGMKELRALRSNDCRDRGDISCCNCC